jgi:Tfp pilus assembly protein PilV
MKSTGTINSMRQSLEAAFTLLEVMIATAIFFAATFAILALVSQNLRAARLLTQTGPHAGMLAAELVLTNRLEEGIESGDFGEFYPQYSWERDILLVGSNGLFQVDFTVFRERDVNSQLSILLYRPESTMMGGAP